MSLHCNDGALAEIPPWTPPPPLKPREFRPPDPERDRCQRCRKLAWQHWTVMPQTAWPHDGSPGWRAGVEASLRHVRAMQAKPRELYHRAFFAALDDLEVHLLAMLQRGTNRSLTEIAEASNP